ncbi:hypothetical protein [Myxococcus qinghaiensis]|uniref:hypothetical protein n=1 Tax=Myxococcus qinghaiensis TaxID=2906758 RepID=UPI0020A78BAA|nr:hypothetical protein [Myxococcus qinghaiensis]MCP3166855.1 hypothetical protein [Myxococcus qinghaiensis]
MRKNNVLRGMLALVVTLGLGTLGCGGAEGAEATEQLNPGQVITDLGQGPAAYKLAPGQDLSQVSVRTQAGPLARLDELVAKSSNAKDLDIGKVTRWVVTNSHEKAAQLFPEYESRVRDSLRTDVTASAVYCDVVIIIFDDGSGVIIIFC